MDMVELARSALPGLTLTHHPIGQWPTPVELREGLGPRRVWVKREDLSHPVYGGNKVRKLEWILPNVQRHGGHLLSMGAIGSNYLVAAGLHGQALDIRLHALLFPQPDSPTARGNARAIAHLAASTTPLPAAGWLPMAALWRSWALRRELGVAPLLVGAGGSSPLGTVGWVMGALELAEQVRRGELPAPDTVVCALGSGGMVAGLLLGLGLTGLPTRVLAVGVTDGIVANRVVVMQLARRTAAELRRAGARVPDPDPRRLEVVSALGPGYGHPTPSGEAAAQEAAAHGLRLEPTYTAKALGLALDRMRAGQLGGEVLFVQSFSAQRPPADRCVEALPPRLDRLLKRGNTPQIAST